MCHCHSRSCCCSGHTCGCHSCGTCGCETSCGCSGVSKNHSSCSCKSCHGSCKDCECNYAKKFLKLADDAWMELLKEKIKEHIQSQSKSMDELARLISEANHEHWQKKMQDKECCGGYEEKLNNFFHQACQRQEQKGEQPNPSNKKQ